MGTILHTYHLVNFASDLVLLVFSFQNFVDKKKKKNSKSSLLLIFFPLDSGIENFVIKEFRAPVLC